MATTDSTLEVNPKEVLPEGAPVDRVVLRYSKPAHRAFFASVMQRLQQPEVSPRQLLGALTDAVEDMEREEAEEAAQVEEAKRRYEEEMRQKALEEAAKRAEEEKKRAELEAAKAAQEAAAAREREEKKRAEEAALEAERRASEEAAKRAVEEAKRAEDEQRRVEEAVRRALDEARRADEEKRRAEEEARAAAEAEARKRAEEEAEKRARACGVCKAPTPKARAVFNTCGHVACLECAEAAAAHGHGRLCCPFCAAPTTYMRLFERELTKDAVALLASPNSPRGVRFAETNEVKEFDKDDDEAVDGQTTVVAVVPKKCGPSSLACGLPWFK